MVEGASGSSVVDAADAAFGKGPSGRGHDNFHTVEGESTASDEQESLVVGLHGPAAEPVLVQEDCSVQWHWTHESQGLTISTTKSHL